MLTLEDARDRVFAALNPLPAESVPLENAAGRILGGPVTAPVNLPGFDNSAMDGYALRAADVAHASADRPVRLRQIGHVAAGGTFTGQLAPGECVRLFTGSPLPAGADAVVMQEDTRPAAARPGEVEVLDVVRPWENVRLRGEDVAAGTAVAGAGEFVRPALAGLLAALGIGRVAVARRPVIGLVATGSELREPGAILAPGEIYESNRNLLAALLAPVATVRVHPLVPDAPEATRDALARALADSDAVVTSGGVSVGEHDHVKDSFTALGGSLDLWKVAMRPGKPFVFGRWQDRLLFGLPGNPVSCFVTCLVLVRPALLRWQGARDCDLRRLPGRLAERLVNRGDRRHFMRVRLDDDSRVHAAGPQGSHHLGSLARANGLVDVPPFAELAAGTPVTVLSWE